MCSNNKPNLNTNIVLTNFIIIMDNQNVKKCVLSINILIGSKILKINFFC